MPDLFRISQDGQIVQVAEQPFVNEVGDLEDFIVKNPQLIGEGTEILGRQVNAGLAGRIDILAIDNTLGSGKVAVVELKNGPADVRVLLQVLRYASWVLSNPDGIRLLLEKNKLKAEDVDLKPRVVVVADSIEDELAELTQYVQAFEFDLVELRRFEQNGENLVMVARKSPTGPPPAGIRVQEEWNWERYESEMNWNSQRVDLGRSLLNRVADKLERNEWPLTPRFRKGYIPFQLSGAKNVVGIEPRWAKGFSVWFRLPKAPEELGITVPSTLQTIWSKDFKIYYVNTTDASFDLSLLDELFSAAYNAAK